MKKKIHVTLIQADLQSEDVDLNLSNFDKLLTKVKKSDIILLPETFNTGFCIKSTHLAEKMNGPTISWMKAKSKEKNCAIAGTLMVKDKGKIYNRLIWISKNKKIYTYDKRHLFSLIQEDKYITHGSSRLIIQEEGWKICPLICYDLRFPVFSRNNVDYDILIYLANWPNKRIEAWNTLLQARSIENQCITIGVNRVGEDSDGFVFNGKSVIFDAFGKKILDTKEHQEDVKSIVLDRDEIIAHRKKINFLKDMDDFFIT